MRRWLVSWLIGALLMAIQAPLVNAGVNRSGAFFDETADWTITGWFATPNPSGSYSTFFVHGDPTYATPYIWIGTTGGSTYVEVFDGTNFIDSVWPAVDTWYMFIAATYAAGTGDLTLYVNSVVAPSATVTIPAFTSPTQMVATDTAGGFSIAGVRAGYVRIRQAVSTPTEIADEMASATAVHADLSDTALATSSSLTDPVGGHDWSAVGSLSTVTGPLTSQLSSAQIYFANDGLHDRISDLGKLYTAAGVELVLPPGSPNWGSNGTVLDGGMARLDDGRIVVNNWDNTYPAVIPASLLASGMIVNVLDFDNSLYSIATDHTDNFYGVQFGGGGVFHPIVLKKISATDASLVTSWTLFAANTAPGPARYSIGVAPDESVAYISADTGGAGWTNTVRRVDLGALTSTAFATEAVPPAHYSCRNILVLRDGTVLIAWDGATEGFVKHYQDDGTLLDTYTLATGEYVQYLQEGVDDTSFWVGVFNPSSSLANRSKIYNIKISDGSVLHSFDASSDTFGSTGAFIVLPGSTPAGPFIAFIRDAQTNNYRDIALGGGSLPVFINWNGTDWIVFGK